MHQNAFGGRAPPEPAGRAYSELSEAPPDPLAGLRGSGKGEGEGRGMGREDGGGGRKGEDPPMSEVR